MLLSNATVAAAFYLDPRLHRLLLSPEFAHMRVMAVEYLKTLHLKASPIFAQSAQPHIISITESESSIEDTSTDLLGELLNQISSPTYSASCTSEAYLAIETFNEFTDTKTNLADFWERKKFSHIILYQLSQIIHAYIFITCIISINVNKNAVQIEILIRQRQLLCIRTKYNVP
ncbi:uncharacterized protein LOC118736540 [Rhagoletis pomonella]|uniref:uncharacterized protein LOC118736540 n=1 Tax=Rhagoletis pomonella TaxID=28610 RepID=UPI001781BF8B|nr:uncharacterized protein LOC118736540 [Rhagoletis pomonella]